MADMDDDLLRMRNAKYDRQGGSSSTMNRPLTDTSQPGSLTSINTDGPSASRFIPLTSPPELHAPRPRRHLPLWLHDTSPPSSRAASPTGSVVSSPTVGGPRMRYTSFSSLLPSPKISSSSGTSTAARRLIKHALTKSTSSKAPSVSPFSVLAPLLPGPLAHTLLVALLIRLVLSLSLHSGQNTPPMYGDFEAQRHWLEVALHVPLRQWYYYDLQWWGMDYPPLTGYISWLCGYVGDRIDRTWFALDKSRGREDDGLKLFMRWTVVVWDALVYVPAVLWWMRVWVRSSKARSVSLLITLLQPSLLLIDFGHFQYNSFMLGLTLLSVSCFSTSRDLLGCMFFVLSLCFKQMSLYYAPAIGTYLLSKCIHQRSPKLFIQYGAVTAATFAVMFAPFLIPGKDGWPLTQVIHRIFPFARGLFEDKVANFWCASNVLIKWKFLLSTTALLRVSTILTLLAFLPAVVLLLQSPDPRLLPYAMLTSSLAFFLFGFQVHEKTILVCMLPVMMVQGEWTVLANNVALFSMWPLLKRDGLGVQYIAILLLWNRLVWRPSSSGKPNIPSRSLIDWISTNWKSALTTGTYAAMVVLHALEAVFPASPIARLPDLWPVLNVLISTPLFFLLWAWSVRAGIEERWAGSEFGMREEDEISNRRRSVPPSPIVGRKKDLTPSPTKKRREGSVGSARQRKDSNSIRELRREGEIGVRARSPLAR